jgi:hypothetical protein
VIDKIKLNHWIRNVKALADQIERIKADPLQHMSEEDLDGYIQCLLKEADDILENQFNEFNL